LQALLERQRAAPLDDRRPRRRGVVRPDRVPRRVERRLTEALEQRFVLGTQIAAGVRAAPVAEVVVHAASRACARSARLP